MGFKYFPKSNHLKRPTNTIERFYTFMVVNISILIVFFMLNYTLNRKNFNIDREFTFMDAVYYTATTHTTVGFGDIYPTSILGKNIAMFHSLTVFVANFYLSIL